MKERAERFHGPFESIEMKGPRGRLEKFINGKPLAKVYLEAHHGQELFVTEEGYLHWKGLKHRHQDGHLGDEVSFSQIKDIFNISETNEKSGVFTSVILARDLHEMELQTGIYEGEWALIFISKPVD